MKPLKPLFLISLLLSLSAFAGGTASWFNSWVYITGLSDLGVVQQSASHANTYGVRTSLTMLAGVGISGDPHFTIDSHTCTGVQSCLATVSFVADVGGDYAATIVGTSTTIGKAHGTTVTHAVKAHVAGANYTLTGVDNGDATATFTLSSTGETALVDPVFAASTVLNVGTVAVLTDTCGPSVPSGTSCNVTVVFGLPPEGGSYGYVLLQAYGNTRRQAPARVTLVLPVIE